MTTKKDIDKYVDYFRRSAYGDETNPIYEILVFENPDKELIYKTGLPLGWPDMGAQDVVGFYYDIDDAIDVLHENICDIRETVYDAAFLICRFPGLYNNVGTEGRMYFLWDNEKDGYFQKEEPNLFKHIAL